MAKRFGWSFLTHHTDRPASEPLLSLLMRLEGSASGYRWMGASSDVEGARRHELRPPRLPQSLAARGARDAAGHLLAVARRAAAADAGRISADANSGRPRQRREDGGEDAVVADAHSPAGRDPRHPGARRAGPQSIARRDALRRRPGRRVRRQRLGGGVALAATRQHDRSHHRPSREQRPSRHRCRNGGGEQTAGLENSASGRRAKHGGGAFAGTVRARSRGSRGGAEDGARSGWSQEPEHRLAA